MASVNRTHIVIFSDEEILAVDEINIFIPDRFCFFIAIYDDLTALFGAVSVSVIGTGYHNIRNIGVLFAYRFIKIEMRFFEIFGIGRVVVEIRNESRHRKRRHIIANRLFCSGTARKAEINIVDIQSSCYDILITVSGTGSASALRYRTAVINDGKNRKIAKTARKGRIIVNADKKVFDVAV